MGLDVSRFEQKAKTVGSAQKHYQAYMSGKAVPNLNGVMERVKANRISNAYDVFDSTEMQRLEFQRSLFRKSDIHYLARLIGNKEDLSLLDIGCNDGGLIRDRLKGLQGIDYVLGIDINEERIAQNLSNSDNGIIDYACCDASADDFVDRLKELYGGELIKFDMAVLSMVLLHTKEPLQVLQNLRYVLNPGSPIFIRDMDDGLTIGYPDEDNILEKTLDLSNRATATGYRHSGRQIPYLLAQAGYKNTRMYIENVTTIGKSMEELDYLYHINFDYIKGDVAIAVRNREEGFSEKDNEDIAHYLSELKKLFHINGFFYNMGSVVITADV